MIGGPEPGRGVYVSGWWDVWAVWVGWNEQPPASSELYALPPEILALRVLVSSDAPPPRGIPERPAASSSAC